jgi:hypothetical protein
LITVVPSVFSNVSVAVASCVPVFASRM